MKYSLGLFLAVLMILPPGFTKDAGKGDKKQIRPLKSRDSYVVIEVTHYDQRKDFYVVANREVGLKAHQINSEFQIVKEADRKARTQWNEWHRDRKDTSNEGRNWVLPPPKKPFLRRHGPYSDEIDAEDKAEALKKAFKDKIHKFRVALWKNPRSNARKIAHLDNLLENGKVVRSKMTEVRQEIIKKEKKFVEGMAENKKKSIWRLAHLAEIEATKRVKAKTKEGEEPDHLLIFEMKQKMLEPIFKQNRINEWQWCAIWEEGYMNKWPKPGGEKVADAGETDKKNKDKKSNPKRKGKKK